MPPEGTATIAESREDLRTKVRSQVVDAKPSFFRLEAQLPKQDHTFIVLQGEVVLWPERRDPHDRQERGRAVAARDFLLVQSDE
jgi:hypothetical protein